MARLPTMDDRRMTERRFESSNHSVSTSQPCEVGDFFLTADTGLSQY